MQNANCQKELEQKFFFLKRVYATHSSYKFLLEETNLSRRTTFPSVSRLLLIWLPSFSLIPAEAVCDARSLPARSTKFCPHEEYMAENFPHERIINVE